jgi:hypothetical protein
MRFLPLRYTSFVSFRVFSLVLGLPRPNYRKIFQAIFADARANLYPMLGVIPDVSDSDACLAKVFQPIAVSR